MTCSSLLPPSPSLYSPRLSLPPPSFAPPHLPPGAEAEFDEPRGLCVDGKGGQAFVCDSNNHCIRTVDLRTGEVGTLKIKEKGV